MRLNSVEQILNQLEKQPGWEKLREYRQLLKCWHNSVSQNTAKHTRPLHINRRVLWVATSSAARAQELSFQRYTLLKKLNQQLPFTLKDIRFSSSGWHQATPINKIEPAIFSLSDKHKSKVNRSSSRLLTKGSNNGSKKITKTLPSTAQAKQSALRWLETIKQNSASFSACPSCGSPTPSAEMKRWNCCYHCIAQKWSSEYNPPTFPEIK